MRCCLCLMFRFFLSLRSTLSFLTQSGDFVKSSSFTDSWFISFFGDGVKNISRLHKIYTHLHISIYIKYSVDFGWPLRIVWIFYFTFSFQIVNCAVDCVLVSPLSLSLTFPLSAYVCFTYLEVCVRACIFGFFSGHSKPKKAR